MARKITIIKIGGMTELQKRIYEYLTDPRRKDVWTPRQQIVLAFVQGADNDLIAEALLGLRHAGWLEVNGGGLTMRYRAVDPTRKVDE